MTLNPHQLRALAAFRRTVAFGGSPVKFDTKETRGIVEDMTADEINVAGGIAESGGFRVMVEADYFQGKEPERFSPISARNQSLYILSSVLRNGIIFELVAGDPTQES